MKTLVAGALLALVLAGCASAPQYKEMLVIGDAISLCAPIPAQGWNHNWGMAATAKENDYVHRLGAELRKNSPELKLIVIQLSENYQGGVSLEEYQGAYEQMIDELCENGRKTVVCVGPWKNIQLEPVIRKAAENRNAIYVSLREIYADPANHAAAEGKFPKLGDMPGDRGMRKIAEAILESLVK